MGALIGHGSGCGMRITGLDEEVGATGKRSDNDNKAFVQAKSVAYRLLTYRPRSCAELRQKLQAKAYHEPVIDAVLEVLARLGYVNDGQFAEQFASSRIRLRGWGRRRIERELGNKGIERRIISVTLSRIFEHDVEIETAKNAAERKLASMRSVDRKTKYRRLAGFLERRGFSFEVIKSILRSSI
jgi:regulatory protein